MRKILLYCAGGMSTSILVNNMKTEAKKQGYLCEIDAFSVDTLNKTGVEADCILLAPQISYQIDDVKSAVTCPVEVIDMLEYGMMDGKKVLNMVKNILGDS